jgi:uncharacterized membrane protein
MITHNRDLMQQARESLKGHWGPAVGITFIYACICMISGAPDMFKLAGLIVSGPLTLGYYGAFLSHARNGEMRVGQLFEGFSSFLTALGAYVLMAVFIILWSLLLIVPGIMAALSYSLTYFIIADDPDIGPMEAIRKSKEMMYGHRWRLCWLGFRFTGWILLGIVTAGIGFLWVGPYMAAAFARFYQDLLDNTATNVNVQSEAT